MAENFYWARLAPFNTKAGNLVRRYGFHEVIYQGGTTPVWYKVSPRLAQELLGLLQVFDNPRSNPLFEIYTDGDRMRVDARENELRLVQLGLVSAAVPTPISTTRAVDLTTEDRQGTPIQGGPSRDAAVPQVPPPMHTLPRELPVQSEAAPVVSVVPTAYAEPTAPYAAFPPAPQDTPLQPFQMQVPTQPEPIPGGGDLTTANLPKSKPAQPRSTR